LHIKTDKYKLIANKEIRKNMKAIFEQLSQYFAIEMTFFLEKLK